MNEIKRVINIILVLEIKVVDMNEFYSIEIFN